MKIGDKVRRNSRYPWCLCTLKAGCWCKKGDFVVTVARDARGSQSGIIVDVEKDGRKLTFLDSSYFVPI